MYTRLKRGPQGKFLQMQLRSSSLAHIVENGLKIHNSVQLSLENEVPWDYFEFQAFIEIYMILIGG